MKRYFLSGFAALGALAGCSSASTMDTYRPATDLFAPRLDITVGAEPKALAMADMDGDGHLDIVVARATGSGAITLLMGKGDGTFKRVDASNQAGDTPYALAVSDFNKDGSLDVAVANYFGAEIAALFGADLQTRLAVASDGSHPFSLAAADLDGGGTQDLVASNQVGDSLNVFLGSGGSFGAATRIALGETPSGLAVGDLDGDGAARLDVAVTLTGSNRLRLLHGQGGGAFMADKITDLAVGQGPVAMALGRIDADTRSDLAVANLIDGTVSVLLAGQGGFLAAQGYPVGLQPAGLALGDVDGDGNMDVVTSNRGGASISVLRGQEAGRLSPAGEVAVGMQPEGIAVGDLNGDGLADVAVANLQSDSISILLARHLH